MDSGMSSGGTGVLQFERPWAASFIMGAMKHLFGILARIKEKRLALAIFLLPEDLQGSLIILSLIR